MLARAAADSTAIERSGRQRLAHLLGADVDLDVQGGAGLGAQEYRIDTDEDRVVVQADEPLALRYAMGELAQSVWADEGAAALHVQHPGEVRSPLAADRTFYFNVAFGFSRPGLTADTWDDETWEDVVEWLLDCRYSRIAFYLWADSGLANEASVMEKDRNVEVRRRLATMTTYAQRCGLKVAFWFSPCNMPRDLLRGHEDLLSPAPYPLGYPALCPSRPGALEFAAEVYAEELRWFADVDAVQVWFYDPGGCWCDVCKSRPAAAAVDQLRALAPVIGRVAPHAEIEVSAWPVWANEQEFGVTYRDEFVEELARWVDSHGRPVTVMDTPVAPTNVLEELGKRGLGRAAFYLDTNVETGWCFLQPSLSLVEQIRADADRDRYDQTVVMRIEEATRWPQDAFVGHSLWTPRADMAATVAWLAQSWAGTASGGQRLAAGLLAWDELLSKGALATDVRLSPFFDGLGDGVGSGTGTRPLGSLVASARAIDLLAAAARGETVVPQQVGRVMSADPTLAPLAPVVESRFAQFVDWVGKGWAGNGAAF